MAARLACMLAVAMLAVVPASLATAQDQDKANQPKVKVGIVVTLSGPGAVLGKHVKDGFDLALAMRGGKLGGRDAQVIVVDDELKPDVAVTRVRRLLDSDRVDFVVGPIFSNILGAIFKPVTSSQAVLISANAGSSLYAGAQCNADFFVASFENNGPHAASGQYAQDKGYKRAFLIAPNYQAGKDAIAGFKSTFKGEIVDEDYVSLSAVDFQADLARIADARPDVIHAFLPGGLGVAFVKQFRQSGLADKVPFLSAFTVDEATLPAVQDAAVGLMGVMSWAPSLDNAANKTFVQGFLAAYHYLPSSYAMQGYDVAQVIDAALVATHGDVADKPRLQAALRAAQIDSPRGRFSFNTNHYPIEDMYALRIGKRADGLFETEVVSKIYDQYKDPYYAQCPLK